MKLISLIIFTLLLASNANAWVTGKATVDEIWAWETGGNGSDKVYFKLVNSSGDGSVVCYISDKEDVLYALVLSLHATRKEADYHCWDKTENTQGIVGHKLHRIISNK